MKMAGIKDMPSGVREALWQMFKDGPVWDGNLVDKESRSWLVGNGFAFKAAGYNALTPSGVEMAVSLGMRGDGQTKTCT